MEMYEELNKFMQQTDMEDKFEMKFIDVEEEDVSAYKELSKVINMGHQLPITFIEGKPAFSGKVDNFKTYQIIKKIGF